VVRRNEFSKDYLDGIGLTNWRCPLTPLDVGAGIRMGATLPGLPLREGYLSANLRAKP
jgi:hypothetical protein